MVLTLLRGSAPKVRVHPPSLKLWRNKGAGTAFGVGKKKRNWQAVIGRDNGFFCG